MKKMLPRVAAVLFALGVFQPAQAADTPVVVELFTSQGCSSCPPSDRILSGLARQDDIIALALHVDYWDYIGWKDEFAAPRNSARQRAYAAEGGRRMVYTPQMIFNGEAHLEGASAPQVSEAIARAHGSAAPRVRLTRKGDELRIRVPATRLDEAVSVDLVRFDPDRTVKILRGENRGRTLTYSNVVTDWRTLRSWDGRGALDLRLRVSGDEGIAILLQYPGPGRIVGAAQLR